ncbi:hypothetical protein ACFQYP_15530 [Nonomuraea antimicrobica]
MVGVGRPAGGLPLDEGRSWLERALATLPAVADPAMRMLVLGKIAMIFVEVGDPRWAELVDDLRRETGGRGLLRREVNAYRSIGGAALFSGHHREGRRLLTAAIEDGAEPDLRGRLELRCLVNLAAADYVAGSWDGLAARLGELRDHFGDEPHERNLVDIVTACLSAVQGRQEAALSPLLDAIAVAHTRGQFDDLVLPLTMLLRLAAARGEPEPVIATAAEAAHHWEAGGLWPVSVRTLPALTEALLAAGRAAEAADVVAQHASRLAGLDAPLAVPALAHARGLLAAAGARWAEAAGSSPPRRTRSSGSRRCTRPRRRTSTPPPASSPWTTRPPPPGSAGPSRRTRVSARAGTWTARPAWAASGASARPRPHPHETASRRTAPHRTGPHRTGPHRTGPHRTGPRRTGRRGMGAHRTARR